MSGYWRLHCRRRYTLDFRLRDLLTQPEISSKSPIFLFRQLSSAESYKGLHLILSILSGFPYASVEVSLSARLETLARFPLP